MDWLKFVDMNANQSQDAEGRLERLRDQLNHFHNWPSAFTFKFILPRSEERESELKTIFASASSVKVRASKNGNYQSYTIIETLGGPDEVFDRYTRAGKIKDILSL